MTDIIFYFGTIIITAAFIGLVTVKFKNEDNIDLSKHKWIIILYIILLVLAIFTWGIMYKMLNSNTNKIIEHNQQIESYING